MTGLTVAGATVLAGRKPILDNASVTFKPGFVTAVIGPNGAGKSTLLAVAAGHLKPVHGRVLLGSDDIRHIPPKLVARRRAVMPQDTVVAFPFTVREVVAMGRSPWATSEAVNREIVTATLQRTELAAFADREITTLSGGERQRTAFARIIAQATPVSGDSVVLLDEPTSAMDIAHAETTLAYLRELAHHGVAVGAVLHDLDAAAAYADEVFLMDRGRIAAAGPVADVCTSDILSAVYHTGIETFTRDGRLHITPARQGAAAHDRFAAMTWHPDPPSS